MTQQQINAYHCRSLKTKYKHLSPPEKRLIKFDEEEAMLERAKSEIWRDIYAKQKPPYPLETTPEDVLDMLDRALSYSDRLMSIFEKRDRLIEKYNLDADKIRNIHMLSNLLSGGSF